MKTQQIPEALGRVISVVKLDMKVIFKKLDIKVIFKKATLLLVCS